MYRGKVTEGNLETPLTRVTSVENAVQCDITDFNIISCDPFLARTPTLVEAILAAGKPEGCRSGRSQAIALIVLRISKPFTAITQEGLFTSDSNSTFQSPRQCSWAVCYESLYCSKIGAHLQRKKMDQSLHKPHIKQCMFPIRASVIKSLRCINTRNRRPIVMGTHQNFKARVTKGRQDPPKCDVFQQSEIDSSKASLAGKFRTWHTAAPERPYNHDEEVCRLRL